MGHVDEGGTELRPADDVASSLAAERERLAGLSSPWMVALALVTLGLSSLRYALENGRWIEWAIVAVTLLPAGYLTVWGGLRWLRVRALDRRLAGGGGEPRLPPGALPALAALLLLPGSAAAQVFQGRVLEGGDAPVATALVRLLDADGRDVAFVLADSAGGYRLVAPEPGTYRLVAERLDFASTPTPLLAVENPDGVYPVDLVGRRVPVPIAGVEVTVQRQREVERAVHLLVGVNPRSLRTPPIPRRVIEDHLAKGHTLVDLVRWSNAPITVMGIGRNTCFQYRRACMSVYLNGVPVGADFWDTLPLDMVETIVVVGNNETIQYGPSIHLYTAGWLR